MIILCGALAIALYIYVIYLTIARAIKDKKRIRKFKRKSKHQIKKDMEKLNELLEYYYV